MTKKKLLTILAITALVALMLAPVGFAAESSLDVYGGPGKSLVEVKPGGGGGAPLPSTGLAVGLLVASGAIALGVGAGMRRLGARGVE